MKPLNQYKDPYETISIMECHKGLVHAAHMGNGCLKKPFPCFQFQETLQKMVRTI